MKEPIPISNYTCDANGNHIADSGKDLEIDYNLLNLPTYLINNTTGDEMFFEYAFGGEKLKKVSIIDDTTRTRLYMGGFEFLDDEPEAFHHGEGRIVLSDSLPRFQFKIADHLGNTVVLFEDKDNSGTISTIIPQDPEDAEVVQRNLYYPFGMQLDGTWKTLTDPRADYLYNGKELEEELRLGWLHYGARHLDPATGRWGQVDPLADSYAPFSPYNYCLNNPVLLIDPDGRAPQNIIIGTTDGHSIDNPGHVVIAIEQYDENGNKNGMVTVFETSLPVRIREEIKGDDKLTDLQKLYQKHKADYSVKEMSREDFEKREFDASFELETTMKEDQTATANLTRAATNEVPYVIGGNNCARYACSAIPKRFGADIGVENPGSPLQISTPNQTAKDLTKLAAEPNSQVSTRKPHDDVSKLPTATKMAEKQ